MKIKKECLDFWKVPVLRYDPSKVLANMSDSKSKRGVSKIYSLQDQAKMYADYDKHSEAVERMISRYDQGSSIPKRFDTNQNARKSRDERSNEYNKSAQQQLEDLKKKKFAEAKSESYLRSIRDPEEKQVDTKNESIEELMKRKRENMYDIVTEFNKNTKKKNNTINKSKESSKKEKPESSRTSKKDKKDKESDKKGGIVRRTEKSSQ